ncbi:gliding motility-associated ABC transporter ATP- binding subunit GldA, gldA [Pediococcus acidilactici D3]|nr:gliding motility-associated ABC transporter ATP- binding subunit GldA, gldA [Pediococcus acidilactici D3]
MTLEVENLVGGYSRVPVLKDVSFEVKAGELVGLIGLNGAGKSTTIKHIIGLLRPQKGTITLEGVTLKTDPKAYKQKMAYIPDRKSTRLNSRQRTKTRSSQAKAR